MKKVLKSMLAIFLMMLMVISTLPLSAVAENGNTSVATESENNYHLENSNDFSEIILNAVEAENNVSIENPENYGVTSICVDNKNATVELSAPDGAKLVVAMYSENGQMLGSGMTDVTSEESTYTVELNVDKIPEYFILKGFLLDCNNSAICKPYICRDYSKTFEEFYEKTTEDFDEKYVINFDDSVDNNFAVFNEETVKVYSSATSNTLAEYDEENDIYVIKKADSAVKGLRNGDVLYLITGSGENDYMIISVSSVSVNGDTVTINSSEESMNEVFEYIKIDVIGGLPEEEAQNVELGNALTLSDTPTANGADNTAEVENEEVVKIETILEYKSYEEDTGLSVEIGGKLSFKFSVGIKVYYDSKLFGDDWFEYRFMHEEKLEFTGSVTGKISVDRDAVAIKTPAGIFVGPFEVSGEFYPIIEMSAAVEIEINFYQKFEQLYNTIDGESRVQTQDKNFIPKVNGKLEIKFGVGAAIKVKWTLVSVEVSVDLCLKFDGEVDSLLMCLLDKYHMCNFCLEGELFFVAKGTISVDIKITEKLKWNLVKGSVGAEIKLCDMHASKYNGLWDVEFKACPHKMYKAEFTITSFDKNKLTKSPLSGATIVLNGGLADNDGDGKLADTTVTTDENGKATAYFLNGSYTVDVYAENHYSDAIRVLIDGDKTYYSLEMLTDGSSSGDSDGKDDTEDKESGDSGVASNPLTGNESVGDIIEFGSYPQSEVTDSSLISALNSKAKIWVSYGYYTGTGDWKDGKMQPSDYMKYADITYNGVKYRAVTFSQYRPSYTGYTSSASNTFQDENGYNTNTTYYFKYEPLEWRVLDPNEGLVMCESIIDSQAYNNTIYYNSSVANSKGSRYAYFQDSTCTTYANDYATSSIREWLNEDFYNTAFTTSEKNEIKKSVQDNSCCRSSYPEFDSATTNDKIFLLSYNEVRNTAYGFSNITGYDKNREAQGTDYAKCQGLYVPTSSSYYGNSYWRLRSPGYRSYYACVVDPGGYVSDLYDVYYTYSGIRPALKFNPKSVIFQSLDEEAEDNGAVENNAVNLFDISNDTCIAGNDYILLNVTGYGENFELTSENLLYIDQLTADSKGNVKTSFIPKTVDTNSTTLLIGDFGNGVEVENVVPTAATTTITSLEVLTMPDKTEYHIGDELDTSGLTLKITYSNGKTYTLSDDVVTCTSDSFDKAGNRTVTVTYKTATCTFDVNVSGHRFGDWKITKEPTVTEDGTRVRTCSVCGEIEEDVAVRTGITVTLKNSEGKVVMTRVIDGGSVEYEFSGFGDGKYTATFEKADYVTREYDINIVAGECACDIDLHLLGDINGDGKVNTLDVARANAQARSVSNLSDYEFSCADVNGDGKVNTLDVARMNSHARSVSLLW